MKKKRPLYWFIIGNVASGKSVMGALLAKKINHAVYIPEPVVTNPFLPLYAKDQKRWGFTCQLFYYLDYVETFHKIVAKKKADVYIIDAGAWTNWFVYGKYLEKQQVVTPDEYKFYKKLCNIFMNVFDYPQPDLLIYANASPKVCVERIASRGWEFQKPMDIKYLTQLDKRLREAKNHFIHHGVPTLEVDTEDIDYRTKEGKEKIMNIISDFLPRK